MDKFNWGVINTGGMFESLMHAILFACDPGTFLFGRPGRDSGQDARSADGETVYQAKYRESMTMDVAIKAALDELGKIIKYKAPTHANFCHWDKVKQWYLVGNFKVNPNDDVKWREKVVPQFAQQQIVANYWSIESLENKLNAHPEIIEVFFEGKNRVFVGLREAYELLTSSSIGGNSFAKPLVDRKNEKEKFITFIENSPSKILPIVGAGGVGKSRFIYEMLYDIQNKGWLVYWGLTESMAQSDSWLKLLIGQKKVCLVIDNLIDIKLLKILLEQLSSSYCDTWKVVLSLRSEKQSPRELLWRHNKLISSPLALKPLSEDDSKALLASELRTLRSEAWLFNAYKYTTGLPGLLWIIIDSVKNDEGYQLPRSMKTVAIDYLDSHIESLPNDSQTTAHTLLVWLAIWDGINFQEAKANAQIIDFLENEGARKNQITQTLEALRESGIVRKVGKQSANYAIQSRFMQEQILCYWLFSDAGGAIILSANGQNTIERLLAGDIPFRDAAISTISRVTYFVNDVATRNNLTQALFDLIEKNSTNGETIDQFNAINLLEKICGTNPEKTIDILTEILNTTKAQMQVSSPFNSSCTLNHDVVISMIPWVLYQTALSVEDNISAKKVLRQFSELIKLENKKVLFERGKRPTELLVRLFGESVHWDGYCPIALQMITFELFNEEEWAWVQYFAQALLKVETLNIETISSWKIQFTRGLVAVGSLAWSTILELRELFFKHLEDFSTIGGQRCNLWEILVDLHHDIHRALMHYSMNSDYRNLYGAFLQKDLDRVLSFLTSNKDKISIEEFTRVRKIWKWYLEFGKERESDKELARIAEKCESIYRSRFKNVLLWFFSDYLRDATRIQLKEKADSGAKELLGASHKDICEFFEEAMRVSEASGLGHRGTGEHIEILADSITNQINSFELLLCRPLGQYLSGILKGKKDNANPIAWALAIKLVQMYIKQLKSYHEADDLRLSIEKIFVNISDLNNFFFDIYGNAHENIIGPLTVVEAQTVLSLSARLSQDCLFPILGIFYWSNKDIVRNEVRKQLDALRNDVKTSSICIANMIQRMELSGIRYKATVDGDTLEWLIDLIINYNLDGKLLSLYEIEWLKQNTKNKLSLKKFVELIGARVRVILTPELKQNINPLPFNFSSNGWCDLDTTNEEDSSWFNKLCEFVFVPSFILHYLIPPMVAELDKEGKLVTGFIDHNLSNKDNSSDLNRLRCLAMLISSYSDETDNWRNIAGPICQRADELPQNDRLGIYQCLQPQKAQACELTDPLETATQLLNSEPKESPILNYRQWKLEYVKR